MFHDKIKGKKDLITILVGVDLVTLSNHTRCLYTETDAKCVKTVATIFQDEKRWAPVYKSEVGNSIMLCTMKVKSCERVDEFV